MSFFTPSTNRNIRLSRRDDDINNSETSRRLPSLSDNNEQNQHNRIAVVGDDNDNEIEITSATSSGVGSGPHLGGGLAQTLQNQHTQQQRRIRREHERQRLRQQRLQARHRRHSNENNFTLDTAPSDQFSGSGLYNNPNTHIHDEQEGPILITSDNEDLESVDMNSIGDPGFYSDTATAGSTDTTSSRVRMVLSADERSIRNARVAQNDHLRSLMGDSNFVPASIANAVELDTANAGSDNAGDVPEDDEIQFLSEREIPDVQVISSNNPGYNVYTPSGSLFVPTTEIRRGGGRVNMVLGDNRNDSRRSSQRRSLRNFVRVERSGRTRQESLRERQVEANRRARDAASNGDTIGERVRRRVETQTHDNPRVVRPRNHPSLSLGGFSNVFRLLQTIANSEHNGITDSISLFDAFPTIGEFYNESLMGNGESTDDVPANVMRILQSRDEERENERVRSRNKIANTEKNKKSKEGKIDNDLRGRYSNNLGSEKQDDVCVLCGVTLLQGVPDKYTEKNGKNLVTKPEDIHELIKEGFISPWNAWERFTNVEIDLSKKVFFGSCGHMYCGRCVNNIMRFRGMTAKERRQELNKYKKTGKSLDRISASMTEFENPTFSAPLKCVAHGCNKRFSGKIPFTELYL